MVDDVNQSIGGAIIWADDGTSTRQDGVVCASDDQGFVSKGSQGLP